jgi:energy-coupling factor transporter ATP-binding protein EcfA2
MENPFRFGGTLGLEEIVDRQDEINQVAQTIRDGEKLFLIGPRRYGKTTVLHAARQLGESKGMKVLYFNAEAYPTLGDLTARIFSAATAALLKPTAKARTSLRGLFSRVKPEISLDLIEQTITGTITIDAESQAEQVPLLVDVLNGIEGLARDRKHPVGVIIDEFQQVIALGGQSAEGQIRAAIQDHRKVGYVFAGSKTRMLAEMTSDHSRPFYRLGARRFLGKIPDADLLPWLTGQFAKGDFSANEEAITHLVATAEEVPYDIQKLAKTCWTLLAAQRTKKLTREIIQRACQTLLEEDGELYAHIWNQLTPYQKIALIETRREKGTGLTSRTTLKRARLNASTMRKSLEALRDKSVLREEEKPNETRWRFEDPLFGMWVELLTI